MDFIIFVINFVFSAAYIILAVRAVLPWFGAGKLNPWGRPLYLLTDPALNVIRMGLPPEKIGLDVSPFVLIILFWVVHRVILLFLT